MVNPLGRSRSNAITDGPPGFKHIKNDGRPQNHEAQERPGSEQYKSQKSTPQFGKLPNQGRNAFQATKDNRSELTPKQQVGFSLVSGFMEKIMKEANRANANNEEHTDKRNQQGQASNFVQQNQEEEKRRVSMQSSQRDDEEDVSASDFFKRLQGAMANPEKFRKDAAQRAAKKQESGPAHETNEGPGMPPPQTRQRGGTMHSAPNPLKDPAGFKRHQQLSQPKTQAQDTVQSEKSSGSRRQREPGRQLHSQIQQQRTLQQKLTGGGQNLPEKQKSIKSDKPMKQPPRHK